MPYTTTSELPGYVQKLPPIKQRQWLAVFNSAYNKVFEQTHSKKKAEQTAFAEANGVVNR